MLKNQNILIILLILFFPVVLYSKTTITSTSSELTPSGFASTADQFDDILQKNGVPIADAFAMANISGYPLGVATLGKFPSFFLGVSFGAGFANMSYFDSQVATERGVVPVAAINPLVYFGIGLSKSFDIIAKLMVFSDDFYKPPLSFESATLDKISFYSFGVKARYCILKEKKVLPGLLKFGGLTVSLGFDFLYGNIGISGKQDYPLDNIEVDPGTGPVLIDLDFEPSYSARVEWYIISITPELLVYFNIFWIFNLYTGFGFPVNFGSFDFVVKGDGTITTDDAAYGGAGPAPWTIGDISIRSKSAYEPLVFMPVYVIGLELAIWKIYLSYETMVNLVNRSDVNMQISFRVQI